MRRRAAALLLVAGCALAGCSSGRGAVTPAAAWVPLARPALAYSSRTGTWVVGAGGTPLLLTVHSAYLGAAWSTDGRYLAWGERPDDPPNAPANHPDADTVSILDTATGRRVVVDAGNSHLSGEVFAVPGAFVLPVSGENNLGHRATELLAVDLAGGVGRLSTRLVRTGLAAMCRADIDPDGYGDGCDTLWTQAVGKRLVAVLTGASTLYYRYSPHVYTVGLDGSVTPLFGPNQDSNDGEPGLVYSADGRHAAVLDAYRDGIDVFSEVLVGGATGPLGRRPTGLPTPPHAVSEVAGLSWTPEGELLVAMAYLRTRQTAPHTPLGPRVLYRCPGGTHCVATAIQASAATEAYDGSLAVVQDGPDPRLPDENETILVLRAGSPDRRLQGYGPIWSPS